ncbi:hypothetical protein ACSZNB_08695 [Aeromonas hydrophila]
MPPNTTAFSSLLAVILAMLSITLGASLAKSLFPLIGAAGTTLFRLGCAALLLSLVFRIWRMPSIDAPCWEPSPMDCRWEQ